jgi:DNA-binding SARP family transcriptional activator
MTTLRISLLGQMRVLGTEDESEIRLTHSIQTLLAYLLLKRGKFVSRDELAGLFWGECSQQNAHDCLNTALWRLRAKLRPTEPAGAGHLVTNYLGEVGFSQMDGCWLDIVEFEALWQRVCEAAPEPRPRDLEDLGRLIALYQGDLLEGFYEDWVVPQRERLRLIYLNSLARLMDYYRLNDDPRRSLEYGQRILASDPLREDVHREIMQLYLDLGQRAMAVQQYRTCCAILTAELSIAPMSETQALYEVALCSSTSLAGGPRPAALQAEDARDGSQDALRRVQMAVDSIEQARSNLDQAMQALERRL